MGTHCILRWTLEMTLGSLTTSQKCRVNIFPSATLCLAVNHFPRAALSSESLPHSVCGSERYGGWRWAPERLRGDDIMDAWWARKHRAGLTLGIKDFFSLALWGFEIRFWRSFFWGSYFFNVRTPGWHVLRSEAGEKEEHIVIPPLHCYRLGSRPFTLLRYQVPPRNGSSVVHSRFTLPDLKGF